MKFGITGVNAGRRTQPDHAATLARMAEQAGFESLWAVEHVVVPAGYASRYPYSEDGKMPGRDEIPIGDPLVWLTFAAAVTERIKLATGILILPQRNPVILAKEAASLDVLSGGRLMLGIGVGWLREEFDALGVPFEGRGARADEYVEALKVLWREPEPTFEGRYASFRDARSYPKPAHDIPIIVGGHSEAAARRAGRYGDGFFPWETTPGDLARLLEIMRASAEEAGRDPDAIEVTCGAMDAATVDAYAEAGVSRVVTPIFGRDAGELERAFADFSEHVMSRFV